MIDNIAILMFSSLIVYTAFRAVKLDKILPWFSEDAEKHLQEITKNAQN